MNKEHEKMPSKVKVRVRRTGENPCVSVHAKREEKPQDLLENVLPTALDEVAKEREDNAQKAEPVVFKSVEHNDEEPSKIEEIKCVPTEEKKTENQTEYYNLPETIPVEQIIVKTKRRLFTRFSEMTLVRKILTAVCVVFVLWSLIPLVCGIIGIGLYAPLFIGLFALFTVTAWDFISSVKSKLWKLLWLIIAIVAMAGAVAFAFVSGHMISASNNTVPANVNNVTVVVLGCKVNGTQPSKMLQGRLDTAAEYLLTHPGTSCIVTGGMGNDENVSEAAVMKQYLVKKGVSASRIKTEDKSTSTKENIEFAIEVANSNNYYTSFYIVTDRFHQLRAKMECDDLGITSYALTCETPWYLTMYYWFREMFGIAHHIVFNN